MNIPKAKKTELEPRPHVPDSKRTRGKDQAADWIQQNVIEEGRWPMDVQDIAEECGWSRQHVTNTLRDYFQPAGGEETPAEITVAEGRARIEFDVPADVDEESYVRGYLQGWIEGKES